MAVCGSGAIESSIQYFDACDGDCELACKREFVTTFFLFSLWCPSHRVLLFCVGTGPTFGDNLQFAMIASARPFQARASGVRQKFTP